jgi:hypothetical protein
MLNVPGKLSWQTYPELEDSLPMLQLRPLEKRFQVPGVESSRSHRFDPFNKNIENKMTNEFKSASNMTLIWKLLMQKKKKKKITDWGNPLIDLF